MPVSASLINQSAQYLEYFWCSMNFVEYYKAVLVGAEEGCGVFQLGTIFERLKVKIESVSVCGNFQS